MAIYLGHTTARRILESKLALTLEPMPSHEMRNPEAGKRAVMATLQDAFRTNLADVKSDVDSTDLLTSFSQYLYARENEPLDLMVPEQKAMRLWPGVQCHVSAAKLPPGSFMLLKPGIYVASPALCLAQLAPSMTTFEIIQLAMSFCGIYHLEDDIDRILYSRNPLTKAEDIGDYMQMAKGLHGARMVEEILEWVIPNSASPMETNMALSLYLPLELGGYGLPKPEMNKKIPLDEPAKLISGQEVYYGDAIWELKGHVPFDMEFQSKEHHAKPGKLGEDIKRQLALQRQGYRVQFVAKEQLDDTNQLNELARLVEEHTGRRLPPAAFEWSIEREDLHTALMAT